MPRDFSHTAWLPLFLAHTEAKGVKERTIWDYRDRIEMFLAMVPDDPRELDEHHLLAYTASLRRKLTRRGAPMKPGAINSYQRPVWTYLRWLYRRRVIDMDLAGLVDKVRVTNVKRRTASEDDRDKLLTVARDRAENPYRNAAIVQMLYWTGLRVSELAGAVMSDYNANTGTMRVVGKGGKLRTVGVGREARLALEEYFANERGGKHDGPMFYGRSERPITTNAIRLMLFSLAKGAGVTVAAHDFRRSFAARMRQDGVDIGAVQRLLGHSSPAMTMVYSELGEQAGALLQYHEWENGIRRIEPKRKAAGR